MKTHIDSSSDATIFPYVYDSEPRRGASVELSRALLESSAFAGSRQVSPAELVDALNADGSALMRNGKTESFIVKLTGTEADLKSMSALSNIKGLILMVNSFYHCTS